jgi:predicted PurR-regulated permease PerM
MRRNLNAEKVKTMYLKQRRETRKLYKEIDQLRRFMWIQFIVILAIGVVTAILWSDVGRIFAAMAGTCCSP